MFRILNCYRICGVEVCWLFYEKVSSISCTTRRNISRKVLDFSPDVQSDVQIAKPPTTPEAVRPGAIVIEQEDGTPSWLSFTTKPMRSEKEKNFYDIFRRIIEGVGEPMPHKSVSDPEPTNLVHTTVYINAGTLRYAVCELFFTLRCLRYIHTICIPVLQVCIPQRRHVSEMLRSSSLHSRWLLLQPKEPGFCDTSGLSSSRNVTTSPNVQSVRTTNSRFSLDNPSNRNHSGRSSFSIEPTSLTSGLFWTSSSSSLSISQEPSWSSSKMEWTTPRQTSLDWEPTPKPKTMTTEMRSKRSSLVSVVSNFLVCYFFCSNRLTKVPFVSRSASPFTRLLGILDIPILPWRSQP